MPILGEVKRGFEVNKLSQYHQRFAWSACEDCGKERWVSVKAKNNEPIHPLCPSCASHYKNLGIVGEQAPNWKGGTFKVPSGYVFVYMKNNTEFSCMANSSGYTQEHRLVMAQHLGRPLLSSEIVHHINGKRDDNRIENLKLLASSKKHFIAVLEENKQLRERITELEKEVKDLEESE